MPKLILILGELAAGKSTLAGHIQENCHIACFTKDRIKELICEKVPFSNREENLNLSHLAFDIMLHTFETLAKTGQTVLLESNFRQNELDCLHAKAEQYGYDVLTIFLYGNLEKLHQRYLARIASGTRHFAHLSQDLSSFDAFEAISVQKHPLSMPGRVIRIDVTDFEENSDLSMLPEIQAFLAP